MNRNLILLFALALSVTSVTTENLVIRNKHRSHHPRPVPEPSGVSDYDYYSMAVEWAGTVCHFKSCSEDHSAPDNWNLHGLWPDKSDGNHPFFCTNTPLQFEQLDSGLRNLLDLYWSGLYSSQQKFIDHEWTKHGTCWRSDYGEIEKMPASVQDTVLRQRSSDQNSSDFLKTSISLSKDVYNVYRTLERAGIIPSSTATYTLAEIQGSLTKLFGGEVTKFQINCQQDEKGASLLSDMSFCLDKNYQPMDCQNLRPSKCDPDRIFYPENRKKIKISVY